MQMVKLVSMSSHLRIIVYLIGVFSLWFFRPEKVMAAPIACNLRYGNFQVQTTLPSTLISGSQTQPIPIAFSGTGINGGTSYKIICAIESSVAIPYYYKDLGEISPILPVGNSITANLPSSCFNLPPDYLAMFAIDANAYVKFEPIDNSGEACTVKGFTLKNVRDTINCSSANFSITTADGKPVRSCVNAGSAVNIAINNLSYSNGSPVNASLKLFVTNSSIGSDGLPITVSNGSYSGSTVVNTSAGSQLLQAQVGDAGAILCSSPTIPILPIGRCSEDDQTLPPPSDNAESVPFALCQQVADAGSTDPNSDYQQCLSCFGSGAGKSVGEGDKEAPKAFWTAFGCVRVSKNGMVQDLLRIGLGISGGFVLLTILYGAFLLTTSSGNPKRVQEGQEMISSAVMGLFFVIFSVIILQFIGVSLLRIPGFGT